MSDIENQTNEQQINASVYPSKKVGGFVWDVCYYFMFLYIPFSLIGVFFGVWAVFFADPAMLNADSVNRNSPIEDKLFQIGLFFSVFVFGVVWLFLIRHFRRRFERN